MNTLKDLMDEIVRYSGRDNDTSAVNSARSAAIRGVSNLPNLHAWNWLRTQYQINVDLMYQTGTIAYNASAGELTLTGGTWPTWAIYGSVLLEGLYYLVQSRTSNTVIVLSTAVRPQSNIAAGTSYSMVRYAYPLPLDFESMQSAMSQPSTATLRYVRPLATWVEWIRFAPGICYTVAPDPTRSGAYSIWFGGQYLADKCVSLVYKRKLFPPRFDDVPSERSSVATTAASAVVAGQNTAFTSAMVGCSFRLSADGDRKPTDFRGLNPYAEERTITAVSGLNSLTCDQPFPDTTVKRLWTISSIIDVPEGPMWQALVGEAWKEFRLVSRMTLSGQEERAEYVRMLELARDWDSKYDGSTFSGPFQNLITPTITYS